MEGRVAQVAGSRRSREDDEDAADPRERVNGSAAPAPPNEAEMFRRACKEGDIATVATMLANPELDPNAKDGDSRGETAFMLACEKGHVGIVELLLTDPRVDPRATDLYGVTGLHVACGAGHVAIVRVLLADGLLDPRTRDGRGGSPLHSACLDGNTEVVRVLLEDPRVDVGARDSRGWTALHKACFRGDTEIARLLLNDARLDVNALNDAGCTAFHLACFTSKDTDDLVRLLLANGKVDVTVSDRLGETALFVPCRKVYMSTGQIEELVRLLLRDGRIDPNARNKDGQTVLYRACDSGRLDVVRGLLEDNRVNLNARARTGSTGFHVACWYGKPDLVRLLLADSRLDLSVKDRRGRTGLDIATEWSTGTVEPSMKSLYSEIIAAIHQRIANDKQLEQRAGKASAIVPARAKDAFWIDEGDVVFSESDCLGRGGFAAVYRARYQWNDVAVKVMFLDRFGPEKTRELLEGEIKVWLGLPYHENVLPLKGYRFEPNYLVSKLCSGGNLKIFLASKGWDARLRIRLLADAAAGVAFLHSRGVIHSDLKAENVVIDLQGGAEPVAMVADFGLAKARLALEETLGALGMSRYGGAGGGTPHYAPPEFFDPEGRLGRPSDVWSFAVMCFQVFNFGKPPFEEIHPERVGVRICTGGPPAPRPWGVPDTLWKLMEGCWNKNQGERPKMEDLVAELVRLRDCGESAPADSVPLTRSVIVDDDRAREETDRSGPQKKVRLGAA